MTKAKAVSIDKSKCTRCGLCIEACPVPCIRIDEKTGNTEIFNEKGCLVCRTCEDNCPTKAITVRRF